MAVARSRCDRLRLPGLGRLFNCDQRAQVCQSLLAIRLRRRSGFDAIREIFHLGAKLIDLRKPGFMDLALAAQA